MADEVAQVSIGFSALPNCGIRTIDSLRPCSLKLSFHPWYIFGTVIFVCHDISFCDLGDRDASKWHVPFTCSVVSAYFTLPTELPRLADQQILLAVPLHEPDPLVCSTSFNNSNSNSINKRICKICLTRSDCFWSSDRSSCNNGNSINRHLEQLQQQQLRQQAL